MKVMRLHTSEFIRRFLIHVLPSGFHRIRHTGFLANGIRRDRIGQIRQLLDAKTEPDQASDEAANTEPADPPAHKLCPKCGGAMVIVETFLRGQTPKCRAPPWEDAA
ncbi:transposase, partial [Planktotalea frisia]|uniref:transposase n=2 Tax=Rhodobacterales TaxID=204455 RepID=UPI0030811476